MRKPGLPFEEHERIGRELKEMRDRLQTLCIQVANAYGTSSRAGKVAMRVPDAVDALRCELDNCVIRENPEREGLTRIYYPGTDPSGG